MKWIRARYEWDDASQWGKWEIRSLATPKPFNRSSPKVAYVIMSRIFTHVQNLVTIPQGVSFPRMCEIAHQKSSLGFVFPSSSNGPQLRPLNRFSRKIVKRRGSAQGCAFSGLERRNLTFNPPYSRKLPFWARFWWDFTMGDAPCKLTLIVIVAL